MASDKGEHYSRHYNVVQTWRLSEKLSLELQKVKYSFKRRIDNQPVDVTYFRLVNLPSKACRLNLSTVKEIRQNLSKVEKEERERAKKIESRSLIGVDRES